LGGRTIRERQSLCTRPRTRLGDKEGGVKNQKENKGGPIRVTVCTAKVWPSVRPGKKKATELKKWSV